MYIFFYKYIYKCSKFYQLSSIKKINKDYKKKAPETYQNLSKKEKKVTVW